MTASSLVTWLEESDSRRQDADLVRNLHVRHPHSQTLDLASNDYLNLARDPRLVAAANEATAKWGTGATGSRLVTGSTELHEELEVALAAFMGAPDALVFSSGYLANLGAITALADRETTIISDAGNHASLIDAIRLSRATSIVVPHRSVPAVEQALLERHTQRAIVVTDAVFSVDGDLAPLQELHQLCQDHDALMIVDEAHSLGVLGDSGRGACFDAGIADSEFVVRTVTASKSLGSQGGAVVGQSLVIQHLINTARSFIFDTALAPGCVAAALAAVTIMSAEPELAGTVRKHARRLAKIGKENGFSSFETDSAVTSLQVDSAREASQLAAHCLERGIAVGCFRPPSVPDGISRLRLTAHAQLTPADFDRFADALHSRP